MTNRDNDWITNCEHQTEFRELLALYRRNVSTMDLPDPDPWWWAWIS